MRKIKWFILVLLTCVLSVYAAFWWIAKEEIYYLCGNFTKGIDQTSVIRQLETASLSHYSLHDLPRGIPQDATIDDNVRQEILFSSNIHLCNSGR
jgi:hypothetical protein